MSRAYQIRVSESLTHHVHVDDGIQANLGLLGILGQERSAALLASELTERGWTVTEGKGVKQLDNGVEIEIDTATGTVNVRAHHEEEVKISAEREGRSYDERGGADRARLETAVRADLTAKAKSADAAAQEQLSERLDQALAGVRTELDEITGAVTRRALIERAGQMGQIMEVAENAAGEMTIRVKL
jgi:hypothetical protein